MKLIPAPRLVLRILRPRTWLEELQPQLPPRVVIVGAGPSREGLEKRPGDVMPTLLLGFFLIIGAGHAHEVLRI